MKKSDSVMPDILIFRVFSSDMFQSLIFVESFVFNVNKSIKCITWTLPPGSIGNR